MKRANWYLFGSGAAMMLTMWDLSQDRWLEAGISACVAIAFYWVYRTIDW